MKRLCPLDKSHPAIYDETYDYIDYEGEHEPCGYSMLQGEIAHCVCGWHPANHGGVAVSILAYHLRDMAL